MRKQEIRDIRTELKKPIPITGSKRWIITKIKAHSGFAKLWEPLRTTIVGPAYLKWIHRVINRYNEVDLLDILNNIDWMEESVKVIIRDVVKERYQEEITLTRVAIQPHIPCNACEIP